MTFKALFHKVFGEPIWTQDFDGDCRKRRMFRTTDGILMTKKIVGWICLNPDGTVAKECYVKRWWRR